jgi:S1-C subfamily serine protease/regulation of enolase protein 1 (concanavalin A-like superfamily)
MDNSDGPMHSEVPRSGPGSFRLEVEIMAKCWIVTVLVLGLAAAEAGAQESLPARVAATVKDATVMIANSDPDHPGVGASGSGFLFRVEGQTGYVATNRHVISPLEGISGGLPAITVLFRSGTRAERKVKAEVVAATTEPDLAILKVTGVPDWPAPIDLLRETELVETMPVFVFGFPFGSRLAPDRGRPSVVVGKGSVSSIRRDDDGKILAVLIDGALNPGNSGGPVVDVQGRLVGIAVAAIRGAHIGIAIAPGDLLAMLAGRPEGLTITPRAGRGDRVELTLDVPLFDPLDNVKSMTFLYLAHGPDIPAPRRDPKGSTWEPLAGAKSVALAVEKHAGRGSLTMPVAADRDLDLMYQIATADSRGRISRTRPGRYLLAIPGPGGAGAAVAGLSSWGDVVDPEDDCTVRVEKGGLSLELPGSHKDLNVELGKANAPRILRRVEGDFVVQVKVCGEFQPVGPSTREGAVPYNGAGLLLWLDADHFIRLERGAGLRNKRVGAFLLFERHELGQAVARNNAYLEQGDVYLKIERRGGQILGWFSTDGREWAEAKPMEVHWPAGLSVGLEALTSSFSPMSVRFEEFSIRQPAAGKPTSR